MSNGGQRTLGAFEAELLSYLGLLMPRYASSPSSCSTTACSSRSGSRCSSPGCTSEYQASSVGRDAARIAAVVNSSRGDIDPMVSLALCLMGYGHNVRVFTNANFVDFCRQRGVEAAPVFSDTEWVLHKLGGLSGAGTEAIRDGAREAMEVAQGWTSENPGVLESPTEALRAFQPHLVICGCQALAPGLNYEREAGVPVVIVHVCRASLELYGDLGQLKPARPSFLAMSEFFDSRPVIRHVTRTGPWIFEEGPSQSDLAKGTPLGGLQAFLKKAGAPVVAVGWGSMFPRHMPPLEMLWLALMALSMAKRRAVILGGWARLEVLGQQLVSGELKNLGSKWAGLAAFAASQVYFINSASHKWLLPRCSCIVHHGGVGTAQTALRTGTPAVVTPIYADEFETSERVRTLSAGVGFEQALPDISPKELAHAIARAERMADNVVAGKMAMRREDGAQCAARKVEDFLQQEVLSGEWHRQHVRAKKRVLGGADREH